MVFGDDRRGAGGGGVPIAGEAGRERGEGKAGRSGRRSRRGLSWDAMREGFARVFGKWLEGCTVEDFDFIGVGVPISEDERLTYAEFAAGVAVGVLRSLMEGEG